ncbi:MAG: acylneuraminate cytidylyltransferase family protein [Planctomycetota bacterium]|jgi:N-acylneuraminate cytidylyltransferase
MKAIALIPARSGSKRVPDKNIRELAGHPLLAYSIAAAKKSKIFRKVVVSTDSPGYGGIAKAYGAGVVMRPAEFATDTSPDIDWVRHALDCLLEAGEVDGITNVFSILRPTSPFRLARTIRKAWRLFSTMEGHSVRAVEKCGQHPGKMWVVSNNDNYMSPLLPFSANGVPWHSRQYAALPKIYVQNASLEIAWVRNVFVERSISGDKVLPFFTVGYEGFDINTEYDWKHAEYLIETGRAQLPEI